MLYIKPGTITRIKNWNKDSVYILTDFDRTITEGSNDTSWSILSKSELMSSEYINDRNKLFNKYRSIELDETMPHDLKNNLMIEWWNKHINLFIEYELKEEVIKFAAKNLRVMCFRPSAKKYLKALYNNNIPVVILSAGIGNFVEQFLIKNNCYFDNIHIISNLIKFENGIATGVSNNVIHSLNKNEASIPNDLKKKIENRENIILLGDVIADIKMAPEEKRENALKIGFVVNEAKDMIEEYKEKFDIVCTEDSGYEDIIKILKNVLDR